MVFILEYKIYVWGTKKGLQKINNLFLKSKEKLLCDKFHMPFKCKCPIPLIFKALKH